MYNKYSHSNRHRKQSPEVFHFYTAKNTVILPNFLVWKFCRKAQFPHNIWRFAWNYAETAFPQNFYTRKLDEVTLFFAVSGALGGSSVLVRCAQFQLNKSVK